MLPNAHQASFSFFFASRKKNNLMKIIIINNLTLFPESKAVLSKKKVPDVSSFVALIEAFVEICSYV